MDVVVIGGHGKVALRLSALLVSGGDAVTSLIRNPDHADDVAATGATPVVADVESLHTDGIAEILRGHDAVVWSAGAGGGNARRTYAVDREAAIRSMDAAESVGVRRYVMVSYFGAGPDHGVPDDHSFQAYAEAKAAADGYLATTGLDWTILGPGTLTDEPGTGEIGIGAEATTSDVPRDDVAAVAAAVLHSPATVGHRIDFNSGSTPIGTAIAALG